MLPVIGLKIKTSQSQAFRSSKLNHRLFFQPSLSLLVFTLTLSKPHPVSTARS